MWFKLKARLASEEKTGSYKSAIQTMTDVEIEERVSIQLPKPKMEGTNLRSDVK
jgi:hypothetical protein